MSLKTWNFIPFLEKKNQHGPKLLVSSLYISRVGELSWGQSDGSLLNSYYIEV